MVKLRRFLRGCFGNAAILYISVSCFTITTLFHQPRSHEIAQYWQLRLGLRVVAILLLALSDLIFLMPPMLAALFGIAWWALKNGMPSAKRWAIAGSIAFVVSAIPLISAGYSMWNYPGYKSMAISLLILTVACTGLGIAGIIAFGRPDTEIDPDGVTQSARVAGDGTSKILDMIALILQIGGTFALINMYTRWGYDNDLPSTHGLESWLQFATVILCVVVIHESAHALVGVALGMKLHAFIIGPFHWRVMGGRWTFQLRPNQFLAVSGAAGLIPVNPDQNRWNEVAMIAAGPVSNLISGAVAAAFAYSAFDQPWEPYWEFFALFASVSLVTSIVNLIPFRPDALYSDGARIYQIFRGGPVAEYHRVVKAVMATLVSPRRPRDYDIDAINRVSAHFTSGHSALLLRLWAKSYYVDRGEVQEASSVLREAERIYQESASDIPAELHESFVIYAVLLRHDAAAAREWWDRMESKKPTRFNGDYWLAKCAALWAKNERVAALEAWTTGHAYLKTVPLTGTYNFDRNCYAWMRDLLEGSVEVEGHGHSRMRAAIESPNADLYRTPALD